jgi:D-glycero-D-manno-heptose 1,7-bisphosphate phosphatase
MRRAVFLDRDGTINAMVYNADFGLVDSPANPGEFKLLSGVCDAIRQINQMGLLAIVVSNQPGVAKGKLSQQMIHQTTQKMYDLLGQADARLDAVYYCLHHPDAVVPEYRMRCDCRKPMPGLLVRAAEEWEVDLRHSYMVGDGITDISAGQAAGCTTFFLNSCKCYHCEELEKHHTRPDYTVKNLAEAVRVINTIQTADGHDFTPYAPVPQMTWAFNTISNNFPVSNVRGE